MDKDNDDEEEEEEDVDVDACTCAHHRFAMLAMSTSCLDKTTFERQSPQMHSKSLTHVWPGRTALHNASTPPPLHKKDSIHK